MKRCLLSVFVFALVFTCMHTYAQTFTKAQINDMEKRLRTMSPAQMMKFRDSLMKAVIGKTAAKVPNGNLLIKKHTFDTTYTTVSFAYSKKTSGQGGSSSYTCNGVSHRAPVLFEANGHTIVQCGFNPHATPGLTGQLDKTVADTKKSQPYMSAVQSAAAGSLAAQMSFSSNSVKDNSILGGATYVEPDVRLLSIDNIGFSFDYDPQQHFSAIAVGANVTLMRTDSYHKTHKESAGIGGSAATDMSQATIAGAGPTKADPTAAYAKVVKTPSGFKVTYTKITHYETGDVTEILTAVIGEPVFDYEAVIQPFKFDYLHWLPKGPKVDGSDDTKGDDSSRFTIFVQDKDDPTKQYPGNFTVKWKLKEVTRYPGFCSNYPLLSGNPNKDKDLLISDSMKTDFHFKSSAVNDSIATGKTDDGILSIVRVMCMDYAAWGKLYAEVTLDDGRVLTARPFYKADAQYITIPYDKDENKLSDAWEIKEQIINKGYGLDWDEDVKPDNKHPGDDISLIDEYRGFLIEDENYKPVHQRFSANTKDLITIALADKSNYGKQYKEAVRRGVFGYGKVTAIKMHHLTNSKYGQAEPGVNATYGRWVNWNSPLPHHTDGVVIYCFDVQNPDGIPNTEAGRFKRQSLASTGPIFAMTPAYLGGQPPSETNYVMMWTYDIIHFNEQVNNTRKWYLPKSAAGNDAFNREVNMHVKHANAYFGKHMDTLTMGTLVDAQADINIGRLISATVTHEICHATGIHHHHLGENWGDYFGVASCPMRYWFAEDTEGNHADWIPMFLTGFWDPSTETTPEGDDMKLCPKDDNCFSQLRLKKDGK